MKETANNLRRDKRDAASGANGAGLNSFSDNFTIFKSIKGKKISSKYQRTYQLQLFKQTHVLKMLERRRCRRVFGLEHERAPFFERAAQAI